MRHEAPSDMNEIRLISLERHEVSPLDIRTTLMLVVEVFEDMASVYLGEAKERGSLDKDKLGALVEASTSQVQPRWR